jgi:hypothetical protein
LSLLPAVIWSKLIFTWPLEKLIVPTLSKRTTFVATIESIVYILIVPSLILSKYTSTFG